MSDQLPSTLVTPSTDGHIGILTVNNPPVNALSPGVPEEIAAGIAAFEADPAVHAIVLIGGGRTFIAGADIKEFGKITAQPDRKRGPGLNATLDVIEACPKPVVAALHGTALGGGLEVAMACHYRVAVASAQVGQPEVKLGIIPGAGGTQRLPRLAGVPKALEMCVAGNPIPAADALRHNIIDSIIEGDLLAGAIAFATSKIGTPVRRTRALPLAPNPDAIEAAREAKPRNLLAAVAAIDAIEAATALAFDAGIAREAELFQDCLFSNQSRSLIHVFFGEREVAKVPDLPKDTPTLPINRAAVVGAGTMGGGIAMVLANAGIPVTLKETDQAALDRGLATIRKNYATSVARGRFTQATMDQRLALIHPTLTYDAFPEADLVIEAVFEGMAVKKQVFAELDKICKPTAILASNTSTLNIDEIASATSRPQSVIGTHFFSPANVMKLLEIVRGATSAPEVIATCMALSKRLAKTGVLVGNCRGFVGNRMFGPYRNQAQALAVEGAPVALIDRTLYDFGMAMGPLATGDLAGLDVGWRIRKEYGDPLGPEDRLCELGHYGQKTGAGWYRYDESRKPHHNPDADAAVEAYRREHGITPREIAPAEILDRCLYALVNEGARLLEEGYAMRAVDIDIIYITGYGFPAYQGGPMKYADLVGLPKVLARIRDFGWTPAPLLTRLAEQGGTFSALPAKPLQQNSKET